MLGFDHVVVHAEGEAQISALKRQLDDIGIPFEPSWGKKAEGFKIANIWSGLQYFEIVQITGNDCKWQAEWVKRHAGGDRGAYCIFFRTKNIEDAYRRLSAAQVKAKPPERTEIKWFLGLLTRKMPWRFCLLDPLPGSKIEIGLIEYDAKVEPVLRKYFEPNTDVAGLLGFENPRVVSTKVKAAEQQILAIETALGEKLDLSVISPKSSANALHLDALLQPGTSFGPFQVADVCVNAPGS